MAYAERHIRRPNRYRKYVDATDVETAEGNPARESLLALLNGDKEGVAERDAQGHWTLPEGAHCT